MAKYARNITTSPQKLSETGKAGAVRQTGTAGATRSRKIINSYETGKSKDRFALMVLPAVAHTDKRLITG